MNEKSVELLNRAVADELSAVHQYMYFHFHCDDQGFDLLAGLFRRTAIEEMGHIELLAERILFLGGEVDMEASASVKKMRGVREMLEQARDMETQSVQDYNRFAIECTSSADSASKQIFERLVADEERHFDVYDVEAGNIARFGDSYLALQSIERSRNTASGGATA